MGLVKLDKFAPSQTPYALMPATFRINQHGHSVVEAIWAGRKNGRTTASVGQLWGYGEKTFEEFIKNVDMRYGGAPRAKWDGEKLITPAAVTPFRHNELVQLLVNVLAIFPRVPFKYEGWYYRKL